MDLDHDIDSEDADPSVPTDLLDLYVELEEANVSPEQFKELYG